MQTWHIRIYRRRRRSRRERQRERELLLAIAREAEWMRKGRMISRQAAYNCVPDLLIAYAAYREWRDNQASNVGRVSG
jgi:hypothetical protein